MKKILLVFLFSAVFLSGCGLLGGGDANTNSNSAPVDDPNQVPKFETAAEAITKGDEYLDGGLYKKAINAFKQAVDLDPELGEAHFKLGVAYSLEEDVEDLPPGVEGNSDIAFRNAVKVYKKYVKENPDDAEAFFNLGRAHGKLFEDKEAADALQKAVKLDEENGLYRTELGAALNKLARYREAIKELEKALEIDPENLYAEDLLEKAEAGKKRVDFKQPEKTGSNSNSNSNTEPGQDTGGPPQSNTGGQPGRPGQGKTIPPPPPLPPPAKTAAPPPNRDR